MTADGLQLAGPLATLVRLPATRPRPTADGAIAVCPACDRRFSSSAVFCPFDGQVLELDPASEAGLDELTPCPQCGSLHESDEGCCELGAEGTAALAHLICPSCAARYRGEVEFCRADGSRLVGIN